MRIDPDLRLLRSDPAPQHQAQQALEAVRDAWRARPEIAAALCDFGRYAEGAALAECSALAGWFGEGGAGVEAVDALVAAMARALHCNVFGHVPFRHQCSEGLSVLQLAQCGGAALSLLCYEDCAATAVPPDTLCFADSERHELVLAGSADVTILRIVEEAQGTARLEAEARQLAEGDCLALAGADAAKRIERIHGRLVVLRLARSPRDPAPSREVRIADGTLVHRASGNRGESHREMMMAVLGKMRRHDAAPVIAAMTREGSEHARWQALRECLALDTAIGFATLRGIAADPVDPLAQPAAALQAQLLAVHPALAELETDPCPA